MSWVDKRERVEREREEATTLFFQKYGQDLRWRHLGYLTPDMRNPLYRCDWCKAEAQWYMSKPAKAFWCATCARELRKMWRKQRHTPKHPWRKREEQEWREDSANAYKGI